MRPEEQLMGWWRNLAQWAIDRPRRAIALMAALPLLAAPGLLRLELRTDGHALVPPGDPAVRVDAEVRDRFGLRDKVLVVVVTDHPEGIYNPETLQRIARLTGELAAIDGIGPGHVLSLATELRERLDPGTGLSFRSFLDPLPETPEAIELLRADLAVPSAAIFRGTLLAEDERAAAVVVGVPGGDLGQRAGIVRQVLAAARGAEESPDRILVAGAPVAETLLGEHILEDLAWLLPLVVAAIAAILWLGCRRLWGVGLGLLEVAACLLFTFGLMGWLGVPVYLTTAMLPMILTSLGLADEVHLFWHYQRALAAADLHGPHPAALRATMRQLARPIVFTSLTTAVGFLSFAISGVLPVFWLGVFTAVGVLFCLLWSLTVIPAALALLPPERMSRRLAPPERGGERRAAGGLIGRWVPPLWRRGWLLSGLLALASVGAAVGATRLFVHDSWIEGFAPGSPFRRATAEIDRRLSGTHLLQLEVHCDPPPQGMPHSWNREGPFLDPAAVDAVGDLEAFARRQGGVGEALGLASQLAALAHFWEMARPERVLPGDPYDMDRLLRRFDLSLGKRRRLEVVDETLARTVVTVLVREADYRRTARLMESFREYERQHLHPRSCRLRFAGDLAVSQAMIPAIVRSQIGSVLLSLAGALVVLLLLYRSLGWALLALLPVAVAVLWVLGFMGGVGIPLGVATSMCCAISLGIGVDFSIHLIERFRSVPGDAVFARAQRAVVETGPAIVANTLLNAGGFGVLVLSQVPANSRLGLLVAVALIASCLLTLLGLGGLLARRGGLGRWPSLRGDLP